jgi:predicted DNA-binding WGR domain protein
MNSVLFRRIDSTCNMARFYRLDVRPDLFGGVCLIREWGRIGSRGRIIAEHYEYEAVALKALRRQANRKTRRGYYLSNEEGSRSRVHGNLSDKNMGL